MASKRKTSSRKSSEKDATVERKKTFRDHDAVTVYANNVELETTPWDIKLRFGTLKRATEDELEVTETAHVYMSPPHARIFHEVLGKQLDFYEQKIAEIQKVGAPKKGSKKE